MQCGNIPAVVGQDEAIILMESAGDVWGWSLSTGE